MPIKAKSMRLESFNALSAKCAYDGVLFYMQSVHIMLVLYIQSKYNLLKCPYYAMLYMQRARLLSALYAMCPYYLMRDM